MRSSISQSHIKLVFLSRTEERSVADTKLPSLFRCWRRSENLIAMETPTNAMISPVVVDTTNHANAIALPVVTSISILLTVLPFRSFFINRNFSACCLVLVIWLINLMTITNAIIWPNGNWDTWWKGYGFCDIQVYARVPLTTAVTTCLLGFTRSLSMAIDVDRHEFIVTKARKQRALLIEFAICWTLPVLQVALFYIVQV